MVTQDVRHIGAAAVVWLVWAEPCFSPLLVPSFRWGWVALHLAACLQLAGAAASILFHVLVVHGLYFDATVVAWQLVYVSFLRSYDHFRELVHLAGSPAVKLVHFRWRSSNPDPSGPGRSLGNPRGERMSDLLGVCCCMLPRRDQQGRDERFC